MLKTHGGYRIRLLRAHHDTTLVVSWLAVQDDSFARILSYASQLLEPNPIILYGSWSNKIVWRGLFQYPGKGLPPSNEILEAKAKQSFCTQSARLF